MSASPAIRCSGRRVAPPTLIVVVTVREDPAEPTLGLAWSHDGHIRSCDLATTNGISCRREVKKGRSGAVNAVGCHQTACLQSDYGSGGRGFESLPARSKPQNSGVFDFGWSQVGHERADQGSDDPVVHSP